MISTTMRRRAAATTSGAVIAAGIFLGTLVTGSTGGPDADPSASGPCTSMPMAGGTDGSGPDVLPLAGQVNAATGSGTSDGTMTVICRVAGRG